MKKSVEDLLASSSERRGGIERALWEISKRPLDSESVEMELTALRRGLRDAWAGASVIPPEIEDWLAVLATFGYRHGFVLGTLPREEIAEHPLVRACYAALREPLANPRGSSWIGLMNKVHCEEPAQERLLRLTIPSLEGDSHGTSVEVRQQYEESPYPVWWTRPHAQPDSHARAVLVAGCGTGAEAVFEALTSPLSRITALDLSRASIAYGMRRAQELDVPNIEWVQGDLLHVARLGKTFDHIASTGVLHHMADPGAGLAALRDVLAPGGEMKIGVYTEADRGRMRAAIALRQRLRIQPAPDAIRAFRQMIYALPPNDPARAVTTCEDFYSISGCRDLVFHPCEWLFTLSSLRDLIATAGMTIKRFLVLPGTLAAFRTAFPDAAENDLDAWGRFEEKFPDAFFGDMYEVVLAKIAS